jgi:hypothetical protein
MGSLSSYGGKLSNFGNTGGAPAAATPDGIDELILAMGGWKTNGVSPITPSIVMSRPSDGVTTPSMWVAPCAVVFSADGTTDSAVTLPYHECLYYWDYGDSAQETEYWQYGATPGTKSKNHDLGPIAGHVYTQPGEYTVTLTVLDAYGNINTTTQAITVTDPDVIFSGTNTICVSNDDDFTGAPAGAVTFTQDVFTGLGPYLIDNHRFLFKRGGTYNTNASTGLQFVSKRNCQIGAFGDESLPKPILRSNFSGGVVLNIFANNSIADNFQVFDIAFDNYTNLASFDGASATLPASLNSVLSEYGHMTFYNLDFINCNSPALRGMGNALIGCSVGAGSNMAGGQNGAGGRDTQLSMWLGNYVNNNGYSEHGLRLQGGRRCFIAHNDLRNPASNGKHAITLRGSNASVAGQVISAWPASTASIPYGQLRVPTVANGYIYRACEGSGSRTTGGVEPTWPTTIGEKVVDNLVTWCCEYVDTTATTTNAVPAYYVSNLHNIYDNLFYTDVQTSGAGIGGSNYLTTISHQGASSAYEVSEDIIWDSNLYYPNTNPQNGTFIQLMVQNSQKLSVRNNLLNLSRPDAASCGTFGVSVFGPTQASMDPASHIFIYNNSLFSNYTAPSSDHDHVAIWFDSGALPTNQIVKNNVAYFPHAVDAFVVKDVGGTVTASNNTTDLQVKTDNPFSVAVPYDAADYKLSASSYAKSAGVDVLIAFLDFYGTARDRRSVDLGAISKDS